MFPNMVDLLPAKALGGAEIEHVNQPDGKFAYLYVVTDNGRELMMTDVPHDRMTTSEVVERAHGDVLIIGLGLGLILHPILLKPTVRSVTVVEKYKDVIDLISPSLSSHKLKLVLGDGFTWLPPEDTLYEVIWIDIIGTMEPLRARFAPYLKPGPDSWLETWEHTEQIRNQKQETR